MLQCYTGFVLHCVTVRPRAVPRVLITGDPEHEYDLFTKKKQEAYHKQDTFHYLPTQDPGRDVQTQSDKNDTRKIPTKSGHDIPGQSPSHTRRDEKEREMSGSHDDTECTCEEDITDVDHLT